MDDTVPCPKCGHEDSLAIEFCTSCHAILRHRCAKCWHMQRGGDTCEKCGTNFAFYAELQLERLVAEQDRVARDKAVAGAGTYPQFLLLTSGNLGALQRALVAGLYRGAYRTDGPRLSCFFAWHLRCRGAGCS
jgi:hypothetical protein